jgi:heat shock protein HslJ
MKLYFKCFRYLPAIILFLACNSTKKNISIPGKDNMASMQKNTTLADSYWKLVELRGKPVQTVSPDEKQIRIKFIQEGNKVEGFGGCNGFGGNYTTKNDFNISISNIISTMIACQDLETENEFFNVLKTADNYYLNGDTLYLNKARMATMAKFVKQ